MSKKVGTFANKNRHGDNFAIINIRLRINKPTRHRVIISAIQIIKSAFGIVIIPSVSERVVYCKLHIACH